MSRESKSRDRDFITITIRGVDEELYKELSALAREMGKTIGELVNDAIKTLLGVVNETKTLSKRIGGEVENALKRSIDYIEINHVETIEVSKKDLEELDKPVVFKNIGKLVIQPDIPYELFNEKIHRIISCKELVIPKNYPKLKVLAKCRFVEKITAYEEE